MMFLQMVFEWFGVFFVDICFVQGDIDKVFFGCGIYVVCSFMIGGSVLWVVVDCIIECCWLMVVDLFEVFFDDLEFVDGVFWVVGLQVSILFVQVVKVFFYLCGIIDKYGVGFDESGIWFIEWENFFNGVYVCEFEVDFVIGEVCIDWYVVVEDIGVVINLMVVEGQMYGGLM